MTTTIRQHFKTDRHLLAGEAPIAPPAPAVPLDVGKGVDNYVRNFEYPMHQRHFEVLESVRHSVQRARSSGALSDREAREILDRLP